MTIEAALHFYKALKVYPTPGDLITIYDKTISKVNSALPCGFGLSANALLTAYPRYTGRDDRVRPRPEDQHDGLSRRRQPRKHVRRPDDAANRRPGLELGPRASSGTSQIAPLLLSHISSPNCELDNERPFDRENGLVCDALLRCTLDDYGWWKLHVAVCSFYTALPVDRLRLWSWMTVWRHANGSLVLVHSSNDEKYWTASRGAWGIVALSVTGSSDRPPFPVDPDIPGIEPSVSPCCPLRRLWAHVILRREVAVWTPFLE